MSELSLRNRQRTRPVDLSLLRRIARALLSELLRLKDYELGLHLVAASEMTRLNKQFLDHLGSTDVITFDYGEETESASSSTLHGEVFICIDDAVKQARRFRTTWQSELARYLVHGVLHLLGYDDLQPRARSELKREENRLLRELELRLPLPRLSKAAPAAAVKGGDRRSQIANSRRRFPLSIPARKPRVRS
jgi:probable rRNA maturation factor